MARVDFFKSVSDRKPEELLRIQTAYWFAKNVHRPQKRDDGERYFEHPVRVARTLIDLDYKDTELIVTALLHDVVEDTFTPPHVLVSLFGTRVWENISRLSKTRYSLDPVTMESNGKIRASADFYYKQIDEACKTVRLVKVSDRVDNTSDLYKFEAARKERYIKETEEFVIPLAEKTEPVLLVKLKENLQKAKDI